MDVWTAIRSKRMVREFEARPLDPAHLTRIVDAGRHAGSSKNQQRWDFVTIRDPEALQRLSGTTIYAKHLPSAGGAIALVVEAPRPDHARSVLWDLGRAAQNIILAAWAMGIGSCPITVQDFELAADVLGLPPDRQCQYIIALGWPADPADLTRAPRAGGRKSYEEVVHAERW